MAKFNLIQNTFRSGEISQKVFSRTDLQLYYQGCEKLENLIPRIQGGVSRRPGTKFFAEATALASVPIKPRLLPYNTVVGGSYILELLNSDFLVTRNFVTGVEEVTNIQTELPVNMNFSEIQITQKDDVMLWVHDTMPPLRFAPDSNNPGEFIIHRMCDPLIYNPSAPAQQFTVPYRDANTSSITLTPSATTGTWSGAGTGITLTASSAYFDATMAFDQAGTYQTQGTYFRIIHGATVGYVKVMEYISSTVVRCTVLQTLGATTAVTNWNESAWSRYRGYPRSVCIFEQRAYYGGSRSEPLRLWGSSLLNIYTMQDDSNPSTTEELALLPYRFDLSSEKNSIIQWLTSKKELTIGTNRAELTSEGRDTNLALGPNNFKSKEHTTVGSMYRQPVKFDNIFLFAERGADKIREFVYDLREAGYRTIPLNYLSEPLFSRAIENYTRAGLGVVPYLKQWCSQNTFSTVWMIDTYGNLVSLTRDRTLDIVAFAHHTIGGEDGDAPVIHSICSIDDGVYDWVVMLVSRTVNGVDKLFIERFAEEFKLTDFDELGSELGFSEMYSAHHTPQYLDCGYTCNETTATDEFEINILGIAGTTVHVVADGSYLGQKTLTRLDPMDTEEYGLLTLDEEYKVVTVGFNYIPYLVTVPVEAGSQIGSAQARVKRVTEVAIKFHNSVGAKIGMSEETLQEIIFRDPTAPIGDPIQPFSGDKILKVDHSYSDQKVQVHVKQDQPLPLYICCITTKGQEVD